MHFRAIWRTWIENIIVKVGFLQTLGIIRELGGRWDLLKYSGDSRMIREGWQHCRMLWEE